jgi:hypothetical protein
MVNLEAERRDTERVSQMFQIALKILGVLVIITIGIGMVFP